MVDADAGLPGAPLPILKRVRSRWRSGRQISDAYPKEDMATQFAALVCTGRELPRLDDEPRTLEIARVRGWPAFRKLPRRDLVSCDCSASVATTST